MGGGGGGGDDARRMEEERQALVEQGIAEVDKIFAGFEGGVPNPAYAQYQATKPDREDFGTNQRGYDKAIAQWEAAAPPTMQSGGPNLYDQYAETHSAYYTPQMQEQGQQALTNIGYDAARKGMTESSAAIDREMDLGVDYKKAVADLANQTQQAENQYRANVESQRQNLYSQIQAGMDPTAASNLAQTTYNTLSAQTPELTPLGDLFGQYAQMSANNMMLQGAGYPGMPTYGSTGLVNPFGGRGGTSQIK